MTIRKHAPEEILQTMSVLHAMGVVGEPMEIHVEEEPRRTPLLYEMVALNAVIFVLTMYVNQSWLLAGLLDKSVLSGNYYKALTHFFLHGSVLHIAMNMLALWSFGRQVHRHFGGVMLWTIYFAAGLFAWVPQLYATPEVQMVGASGAIMGLWGAMIAATARLRDVPRGHRKLSEKLSLGTMMVYLTLQIVLDNSIPQIAGWAHLGGLFAGFVIGFFATLDGGEVVYASHKGVVQVLGTTVVRSRSKSSFRDRISAIKVGLTGSFDLANDFLVVEHQKLGAWDRRQYSYSVLAGTEPTLKAAERWYLVGDSTGTNPDYQLFSDVLDEQPKGEVRTIRKS